MPPPRSTPTRLGPRGSWEARRAVPRARTVPAARPHLHRRHPDVGAIPFLPSHSFPLCIPYSLSVSSFTPAGSSRWATSASPVRPDQPSSSDQLGKTRLLILNKDFHTSALANPGFNSTSLYTPDTWYRENDVSRKRIKTLNVTNKR